MDQKIKKKDFENLNQTEVMLKCVSLILNRNKVDRLEEVLEETKILYEFVTKNEEL